ncbi:hypothetical protein [Streptomyces sp. NPDC101237]|uniref:hypothetical protein n=1 Tax=Streptomyces sp. NPDC101237 TaxID=3366139 RepID=UPI00382C7AFF
MSLSFLTDAVEAIRANWDELYGLLDVPARREAREILADAEADPEAAAAELHALVKPFVPPGHPLRPLLTPSGVRFRPAVGPAAERPSLLASLLLLRSDDAREAPGPEGPPAGAPAPVAVPSYRPDQDDAWLLAEPSVDLSAQVLATARFRHLIRLTDGQDTAHVPAFQLDPVTGDPYPVVVEINRMLSADEDPWGAADWWLGSNVWLNAAPARLLGTGADDALLSAARAETPEW